MLAAEHGNAKRAAQLIDQAIGLDASQPAWHAQLGRLQLALHDPQGALKSAHRGLALAPQAALTLDTLGVVLSRAGAHDEAVHPLREAVSRQPDVADYQYNLATAEQFLGRFREAAAGFRAALRLQPRSCRNWSALSEVAPGGLDASEVAAVQKELARPDLGADDELHLCHALARVHERDHQPQMAMTTLMRGKQRKRTTLPRRAGEDEALFAAVRGLCDAAFCAHGDGFQTTEPIFVMGMPRSGTTLVERILSSHPAVLSAGELPHFSLAVKRAAATPGARVLDVATIEAARDIDFSAVGRAYLESTRPRTGSTAHFIDKMPLNVLYAGLIRRALPRARIICLRRGAADTCLSNYRQLFSTTFSHYDYALDLTDTARFVAGFEKLARHWSTVLGDAWLEVRYEDVVADLEGQARRLLAFCGLPWDPACLDFHRNAAPVSTASSVQVRSPIYATSVGRWRKYRPMIDPALEELARLGVAPD